MLSASLKNFVAVLIVAVSGCVLLSACNSGDGGSSQSSGNSGGNTSVTIPTGPPAGLPKGFSFSPYKDTGINLNWTTGMMSTKITGTTHVTSILNVLPQGLNTITWAFATGTCGSENWSGFDAQTFANANVNAFDQADVYYIVGTGGAAAAFHCTSASGLQNFISRYYSAHMLGVDFDIEHPTTASEANGLISAVKAAQKKYPDMRFSFTIATFGSSTRTGSTLNATGQTVMQAIADKGLTGEYINLMTMDYGTASANVCVLDNGKCDMGQSAIAAAQAFHKEYSFPYDHIEITPMIGQNDTSDEVFTLQDADEVAAFAKQVGLGGIHFWSFDRDNGCSGSLNTCNLTGRPVFAFTNEFIIGLGL